jgi:hypothetical protein
MPTCVAVSALLLSKLDSSGSGLGPVASDNRENKPLGSIQHLEFNFLVGCLTTPSASI